MQVGGEEGFLRLCPERNPNPKRWGGGIRPEPEQFSRWRRLREKCATPSAEVFWKSLE